MRKTPHEISRIRLCNAMLMRGYTAKGLGLITGVSTSAIDKFRTARLRPCAETACKIETALKARVWTRPSEYKARMSRIVPASRMAAASIAKQAREDFAVPKTSK